MYNFIGLWIRFVWALTLCLLGVLVLILTRNKAKKFEQILLLLLIASMLFFCVVPIISSITNPSIKSIEGTFEGYARRQGISPFELQYCFVSEGKKSYIEMDSISKKFIYPDELVVGQSYIVYFDDSQNLIVKIAEK